ncbi:MAG: enoyl-CoA hydratase/isomerase family protein [Planctomycetales bacterium]|nr:enoyl-CoA hydratase/isomerase family protein [Planctomycetales bacterium]
MAHDDLVLYQVVDGVAVLTLNHPPVNALAAAVVECLGACLERAIEDVAVQAVVVLGGGSTFSAGADIHELEQLLSGERVLDERLQRLIFACEDSPKPLLAALHGSVLGGGLELALGCHYRLADEQAQLGMPEVKLGLIPGAMGTQRLPRLCGPDLAAEMCASARLLSAAEALQAGLVDRVATGDLRSAALHFAQQLVATKQAPRRTRELSERLGKPAEHQAAFEALRQRMSRQARGQLAPQLAIDAVEIAATVPFREGVRRERELFQQCLSSQQAAAQIHIFWGQRTVGKLPGIRPPTPPRSIRTAGIVGAGTMGGGIAMTYLNAGIPVVLKEVDTEQLDQGLARIREQYASAVQRGRLTEEQVAQRLARLTPTVDYADLAEVDVVVEAVFEGLQLKQQVFAELDRVVQPEAILATNTSTLNIDAIAAATGRPESVVGHHFFSPAQVMRLLEVVRGSATSDAVLARSMELAKRLGKTAVLVGNCFGFVGNRMFWPYLREAQFLLEEGARVEQVDQALVDFGMAMGPHAVIDLAGIDVGWRVDQERILRLPPGMRQPLVAKQLYALNRLGQKSGAGWYRYEGRQPRPDPEVEKLIQRTAAEAGIEQRSISAEEIVERTTCALINEGARIVQEGIAQRSVDIDVIYVYGYGFPAWRGGPMFYADSLGLKKVYQCICRLRETHGFWWEPAPLLEELAGCGRSFSDYNAGRAAGMS